jgi:hypothetical protein
LPDHQRELGLVLPREHLVGGGNDGGRLAIVHEAQQVVGNRRGSLDLHQRADDLAWLALAGNVEVLQRALRLGAPQVLGRHLDRAERVFLDAGRHAVLRTMNRDGDRSQSVTVPESAPRWAPAPSTQRGQPCRASAAENAR